MKCSNCGAELNEYDMFCKVCGTMVQQGGNNQNDNVGHNGGQENTIQNNYSQHGNGAVDITKNNYNTDENRTKWLYNT